MSDYNDVLDSDSRASKRRKPGSFLGLRWSSKFLELYLAEWFNLFLALLLAAIFIMSVLTMQLPHWRETFLDILVDFRTIVGF